MTDFLSKIKASLFKKINKDDFIGKLIEKFLTKEFITYVIFGLLTTVINLLTFYVFKELFISIGWEGTLNGLISEGTWLYNILVDGTDYLDANFIAWVVAAVFAFITNKLWVFESKSWKPSVALKEFIEFIGARILSFAIETVLMVILVTFLSLPEMLSKLAVGIIIIILNYVFSKLFVFKKKQ